MDTYEELKKEDDSDVPIINDKYNYLKVIKWVSTFTNCLSQTYVSIEPLVNVLLESSAVPSEVGDPLEAGTYHGTSGSLHEELLYILSHNRPIYKHKNTPV